MLRSSCFHQKGLNSLYSLIFSILRPPKHRFVFLLSILNPEAVISPCFVCVSCSLLLTKSRNQTKPPYLKDGSFHGFKPLSFQTCAKIINNAGVFKAKLTVFFFCCEIKRFHPKRFILDNVQDCILAKMSSM